MLAVVSLLTSLAAHAGAVPDAAFWQGRTGGALSPGTFSGSAVASFGNDRLTRLANIRESARAIAGADLLLDVSSDRAFMQMPFSQHYGVRMDMNARVVDARASKPIAGVYCHQLDETHSTYDELLADHAARLKAAFEAQRDACLQVFRSGISRRSV